MMSDSDTGRTLLYRTLKKLGIFEGTSNSYTYWVRAQFLLAYDGHRIANNTQCNSPRTLHNRNR